jgi:cold shock CspA family protein
VRFDGILKKWNDDRGFGFIAPTRGGDEIFVHISAFPRDGSRPRIGEPVSFAVSTNDDGKKQAVAVLRPGAPPRPSSALGARPAQPRRHWAGGALSLALILGLGTLGYGEYQKRIGPTAPGPTAASQTTAEVRTPAQQSSQWRCDGRTRCPQMTSCAEAKFFLANCRGTQMDGDHDRIPCEDQWCGDGWR